MKWVVRKGGIPTNDAKEKLSFEEIDLQIQDGDPDLPEVLFKLGYVEWVTYPGPLNNFEPIKIKGASRKYEVFCGGFLYYHDVEFKKYNDKEDRRGFTTDEKGNPQWKEYPDTYIGFDGEKYQSIDFEHKIYFEWFKEKGNDIVRIFINSTPPELNADPPPPPEPPPPES